MSIAPLLSLSYWNRIGSSSNFFIPFYCSDHTSVKKAVLGSFLQDVQTCSHCHCSRRHTWEIQPYIRKIPAGNILTSSVILYSVGLPSPALQTFGIPNLATINPKMLFHNQSLCLQPPTQSVWKHSQGLLLRSPKEKGNPLVLGGDERSHSPGQSAKYGSHSILELTCNKTAEFKLVQVHV